MLQYNNDYKSKPKRTVIKTKQNVSRKKLHKHKYTIIVILKIKQILKYYACITYIYIYSCAVV